MQKHIIKFIAVCAVLLISTNCIAKMTKINDSKLANISAKSGMDIMVELGILSIDDFRYSNTGYIEFSDISISDDTGGDITLGTMADPFTLDIKGRNPAADLTITDGFWEWDDKNNNDLDVWNWTQGSISGDGDGIGSYIALGFPDNPANIDPITIKINTLNFNDRYIGTQVDTSATAADTLTDLEIKGIQLNYLDDSTSSHLYIASCFYSNPILTYSSNTAESGDYAISDSEYDSSINIQRNETTAPLYPGDPDPATDGSQDISSTTHPEYAPDQILGFDTAGGIFIDLAMQAKINELKYVYNPGAALDSYLKITNIHLFGDFATAYNVNPAPADWPTLRGALTLGLFQDDPMTIDVSGGTSPKITIILPIKGSIRIENVSLKHENSADNNTHPDANILGPVFVDLIDATGTSPNGPDRYIKIEFPVARTAATDWLY